MTAGHISCSDNMAKVVHALCCIPQSISWFYLKLLWMSMLLLFVTFYNGFSHEMSILAYRKNSNIITHICVMHTANFDGKIVEKCQFSCIIRPSVLCTVVRRRRRRHPQQTLQTEQAWNKIASLQACVWTPCAVWSVSVYRHVGRRLLGPFWC